MNASEESNNVSLKLEEKHKYLSFRDGSPIKAFEDRCTRNLKFMSFRILIFIRTGSSEKSIDLSYGTK